MTETQLGLLTDALRLTRAGFRVFPVGEEGKPLVSRYHGVKPYREQELRRFVWDRALFVGVTLGPNEVILDVDHKDGDRQGWDHLRWLEGTYGCLPSTYRQETKSSGLHLLFKLPEGVAEKNLAEEILLPDGRPSHIDIVRHSYRYARVFSVNMWLSVDRDAIPSVPATWIQALVKKPRVSSMDHSRSGPPTPSLDFQETLTLIAHTPEGARNSTLSDKAFVMFLRGHTSEPEIAALREAGTTSGLPDVEVHEVLNAALSAAYSRYRPVAHWVERVRDAALRHTPRSASRITALAVVLAEKTLTFPADTWLALGTRDAAERLGLSVGTASSYLTWLRTSGFVESKSTGQRGLAMMYKIVANSNTCPPPQEKQVFVFDRIFGISHLHQRYRTELVTAPAFQRMGGELARKPTLRPSAIKILTSLESGKLSMKELSAETGLSMATVRRAVKELDSCGLVRVSEQQVVPEFEGDCEQALAEWSEFHQLGLRDEVRRKRHDQQRFEYGKYLLWKDGVPIAGHPGARLKGLIGPAPDQPKGRRHVVARIVRQRGRPIQAVLEPAE